MEKPTVGVESLDMEVVIRYNPVTRDFSLTGCDENPVVAWGMLRYAESRLRRGLAQADIVEQMKNSPRVSVPGGLLS